MNILNFKNYPQGLTLLELMIAVSLFTIVMLISTTMFIKAIDNQKQSVNSNTLQQGLNYALSVMSSEAAGVVPNPVGCISTLSPCAATDFFCTDNANARMYYRNASSACVVYEIETDGTIPRLKMTQAGTIAYLTPKTMKITNLTFSVGNTDDENYPIGEATMSITGQTLSGVDYPETLILQTSVATNPQ